MTAKTFFFPGSNFSIREWRINRVRERIARNKKVVTTMTELLTCTATTHFVFEIPRIMGKIARDQQLLARLQGFAQNHDAQLRQSIKIQNKGKEQS